MSMTSPISLLKHLDLCNYSSSQLARLARIQVSTHVLDSLLDVDAAPSLGSFERQVLHVVRDSVLFLCLVAASSVDEHADGRRLSVSALPNHSPSREAPVTPHELRLRAW